MSTSPQLPANEPDAISASPAAAPFKTSRQRTKNRHPLVQMLGLVSSIWGAAILLSALIIITGIATYHERDYGREITAVMFYHSWWFNLIFALLALNIFGAAAVRFPWTKQQAGFVITHAGLLTVMLGFAIAGTNRLDGMLAAPQGQPAKIIERESEVLSAVIEESGQRGAVEFEVTRYANYPGFWRYTGDLILRNLPSFLHPRDREPWRLVRYPMLSDPNQRVHLMDLAGHPIYLRRVVDTGAHELIWEPATDGRAVAHFTMTTIGEAFGAESGRQRDIFLPRGQRVELGPIAIRHHQAAVPEAVLGLLEMEDVASSHFPAMGRLRLRDSDGVTHDVPVTISDDGENDQRIVELHEHLAVEFVTYQPHIVVDGEGRFTSPSSTPLAPFLVFRIGVGSGEDRQWTNDILADGLSFYPTRIADGLWASWQHPTAWRGHPERSLGSTIDLMHLENGGFAIVRASNQGGVTTVGKAESGWSHTTGMGVGDITTAFATYWPAARQVPRPVFMEAMNKDRAANWIEIQIGEGSNAPRRWIRRNSGETISLPNGPSVLLTYGRKEYDLLDRHGFEVTLQRFINERDPGGEGNASYASEVRIRYADGSSATNHVISMNEPLHKHGVTLYQTARSEQPDGTFVSFFTVAQDPGRPFKYLGSLILVAGIVTMYVMKSRRRREPTPKSKAKNP